MKSDQGKVDEMTLALLRRRSKAVLCSICTEMRFIGRRVTRNEIKVTQGVCSTLRSCTEYRLIASVLIDAYKWNPALNFKRQIMR